MESIYWVLSWACHRRCKHCYDDRFRPYVRQDLERVLAEGERAFPAIVRNLPDDLTWIDAAGERQPGRLILAGGEVLLDGFRERIFYPTLEAIEAKWGANRGVRIFVQTTGDRLEPAHIEGMLARGVWSIAISGFDDFHVGMTGVKQERLRARIDAMMARQGVTQTKLGAPERHGSDGPYYLYFGAQPQSWIGELWPRGRAWANDLSSATYETNFCARHSGAKDFLNLSGAGAEVSIEPGGDVFPCCLKTKAPLGNLVEERLEDILDSLRGEPVFEALNAGDPERMGESLGISRSDFARLSETSTPKGRPFRNPCIGCDRLFETQVGDRLRDVRRQRLARATAEASAPAWKPPSL
jgi:MoaA/NifB/PqqE/SkfB family radical SAM enzyme